MLFKVIRGILSPILTGLDALTSPKSIQRSKELQDIIDLETKNLIMYQYPSCPFCIKVRRQIKRLGLNIELRDAKNNPEFKDELLTQGGKNQVPCLLIQSEGKSQWMYESSAINNYLSEQFLNRKV